MSFLTSQQWVSGQAVETWLDNYYASRGFVISRTTPYEERSLCLGDRIFSRGKRRWYVEYKSGIQTGATGNIFIETISVDRTGKPGWAYTCRADYLLYACLLNSKILVFVPNDLRRQVDKLRSEFREVPTNKGQNATYKTYGLLLPLEYAEHNLAAKIIGI